MGCINSKKERVRCKRDLPQSPKHESLPVTPTRELAPPATETKLTHPPTDSKSEVSKQNSIEVSKQNSIEVVKEALLKYLGPELESYLRKRGKSFVEELVTAEDTEDLVLQHNDHPYALFPNHNLTHMNFNTYFPARLITINHDPIILFVFHVKTESGEVLTSPYLPSNAENGRVVPCKESLDITTCLRNVTPVDALVAALSKLFSSEGAHSFMWTQGGESQQEFNISQEKEERTFYWEFSGKEGISFVADARGKALTAKLKPRI